MIKFKTKDCVQASNSSIHHSVSISLKKIIHPLKFRDGFLILCISELLVISSFLTQTQLPYHEIKDICIFLLNPNSIPPDKAISLYIQPPNTTSFIFYGAVSITRPSDVLSLPWPDPAEGAAVGTPKIGVSVEDLTAVPAAVDTGMEKKVEKMVMKVGENLFNFMQSFCGVDGSRLVVSMDILDRWFKKFQERARRDPEYLKGFAAV